MIVKCYAVLDAKISDFHLAIFDIKDDGAIRQFNDAVNDTKTKWNRHPEDYSLWYVGEFDTSKGTMEGHIPNNLVNATALLSLRNPGPQMDLFSKNGEEVKETIIN